MCVEGGIQLKSLMYAGLGGKGSKAQRSTDKSHSPMAELLSSGNGGGCVSCCMRFANFR